MARREILAWPVENHDLFAEFLLGSRRESRPEQVDVPNDVPEPVGDCGQYLPGPDEYPEVGGLIAHDIGKLRARAQDGTKLT